MTSRKSFSKLFITSLRNHIWSIALTCIGMIFSFPIYAALSVAIIRNQFYSNVYKEDVLAKVFARNVCGESNFILIGTTMILAVIIALNGFSYLFSKQKVDLYHSMPVKRGHLFLINYLAGIVTYVVPYILFMMTMFGVAKANGFLIGNGIKSAFVMLGINILGFLGLYSVTVLAIMLTGNIMVSLLANACLVFYGIAVKGLIAWCNELFFVTYSSSSFSVDLPGCLSPLISYVELINGMNTFAGRWELNAGSIIGYVIFVIVLIAINYCLYGYRPSEAAEKSIAFKRIMPVISVMLLVPFTVFGSVFFEQTVQNNGRINYGWLVFGGVIALVIFHMVIQAICYRDFRSLYKNLYNPLIAGIIVAIIFFIYGFDIIGYDNYNPSQKEKFVSAAIGSYNIQGYEEYYNFDAEKNEYGDSYYWVDALEYRLDHMNITDKSLINDFINTAIVESKYLDDLNNEINAGEKDGTDVFQGTAFVDFDVKYSFANGKYVYRHYSIDLLKHMDLYDRLYKNEEYKEGVFDILTASDENIYNIKYANALGDVEAKLSREQMLNIVSTVRDELKKQGAYELKDSVPVGYIYNEKTVLSHDYYDTFRLNKVYIYPSFTNTIKLLDEYGIDIYKGLNIDNIDSIIVTNYDVSSEDLEIAYDEVYLDATEDVMAKRMMYDDNSANHEYTDPRDIRKIFEGSISAEMAGVEPVFNNTENLEVEIYFKQMPGTYNYPVLFNFTKGSVPDFVARDVNYTMK